MGSSACAGPINEAWHRARLMYQEQRGSDRTRLFEIVPVLRLNNVTPSRCSAHGPRLTRVLLVPMALHIM